jgi:hypothetical protein
VEYLRADVQIVKDLPIELQSLDLEATGSLTWRFQRKPLPPFTWSTFYHCCSELVLCTYWVLGTALHLIRFPLTFRYGILDLL